MLTALMNESLTACLLWCYWLFSLFGYSKRPSGKLVYLPYHSHFYWIMKLLVHKGEKKFIPSFHSDKKTLLVVDFLKSPHSPIVFNVEKILVYKKRADIQTLIFDINNKPKDVCVCNFMLNMNTLERCCSDRNPHACEEKKRVQTMTSSQIDAIWLQIVASLFHEASPSFPQSLKKKHLKF